MKAIRLWWAYFYATRVCLWMSYCVCWWFWWFILSLFMNNLYSLRVRWVFRDVLWRMKRDCWVNAYSNCCLMLLLICTISWLYLSSIYESISLLSTNWSINFFILVYLMVCASCLLCCWFILFFFNNLMHVFMLILIICWLFL